MDGFPPDLVLIDVDPRPGPPGFFLAPPRPPRVERPSTRCELKLFVFFFSKYSAFL
jgi:hypothetical protein